VLPFMNFKPLSCYDLRHATVRMAGRVATAAGEASHFHTLLSRG
jgi:hypothetical protein